MTAKEIYNKTKKFPTRLLLLNIAVAGVSLVVFILIAVIGALFKSGGLMFGGAIIALILYSVGSNIMQHYIGYMFKYGAVHTIANACVTGKVSNNYFDESVEYIKSGFLQANIYLVVDKMVHAAVRGVTKIANVVLQFLPNNIKNFVDMFINIYLDYIDECCLAYAILHSDQNVAKSSCDGIVLYYQNAKGFLAPAFKTSLRIVITKGVIFLVGFLFMFFPPLTVIWWLVTLSAITPYLNHRILCNTIYEYLRYATTATVNTDLYGTLSNVRPFKKLQEKINDKSFDPAPGNPANTQAFMRNMNNQQASDIPVMNNVAVPEPAINAPSKEQMMWQQAWNRMSPEQKSTYNSMGPNEQREWKKQILKALFNYDA